MTQQDKEEIQSDDKVTEETNIIFPDLSPPTSRFMNFYGEVNEGVCSEFIDGLYYLKNTGVKEEPSEDPAEPPTKTYEPIEVVVSTEGGSVQDMFSAYDCIRDVRRNYDIGMTGVGKIMSAGVLILASGTKGQRRAGKNCRFMLHSISGGNFGSLKELQNDLKEVKWYQNRYIKSLSDETSMPEAKIRNIFRRKSDTYFDADQALEWGIIDEVI